MMDVYWKHHPACEAPVERIEATDRLIARAKRPIVYRLCGLKEEEIAVVQGREETLEETWPSRRSTRASVSSYQKPGA